MAQRKSYVNGTWKYFIKLNESIAQCNECGMRCKFRTTNSSQLREHLKCMHNIDVMKKPINWMWQYYKQLGESTAQCCIDKCKFICTFHKSMNPLQIHLVDVHKNHISGEPISRILEHCKIVTEGIKCKYCGEIYEVLDGLYKHLRNIHQITASQPERNQKRERQCRSSSSSNSDYGLYGLMRDPMEYYQMSQR